MRTLHHLEVSATIYSSRLFDAYGCVFNKCRSDGFAHPTCAVLCALMRFIFDVVDIQYFCGVQQRIVAAIFDKWHRSFTLLAIHASKSVFTFVRRGDASKELAMVVSQRHDLGTLKLQPWL